MGIEKGRREAHRGRLAVALDVEIACAGSVDRHEHVGQDPALGDLHAVGLDHLGLAVALVDLQRIVGRVGFLDTSARGGVEARYRQAHAAPVREEDRLLHKALAERTAAVDEPAVVVLDGAGEDLARRSGALADEHLQTHVLERSPAIGRVVLALAVKAFQIDYRIALLEEGVGEQQGLVEVAAGVVADIHDQLLHPLALKLGCRFRELLEGSPREFRKTHVAGSIAHHEGGVDAVGRNLAPCDFERNDLGVTLDGDGDLGAGMTAHAAYHTVLGVLTAGNLYGVDLQEPVSRHQPDLL